MVAALAGCASAPPKPEPAPQAAEPQRPSPEEVRRRNIDFFLARAEEAQHKGFFTEPAGASAYDYYLRVRLLEPDNAQAAAGIQTIVLEMIERARDALRSRAFGQVNSMLNRAEELAPGNPLASELRAQLVRERSRASEGLPSGEAVPLPESGLSNRSQQLVVLLRDVADRIRREEMRVLIVVRNDAEGRWVYQQLREAVPGYRVRGDIKLGSPPRLLLMLPEKENGT